VGPDGEEHAFATFDGRHWRLTDSEALPEADRAAFRQWVAEQEGFDAARVDIHDAGLRDRADMEGLDGAAFPTRGGGTAEEATEAARNLAHAGEGLLITRSDGEVRLDIEAPGGPIHATLRPGALPAGAAPRRVQGPDGQYQILLPEGASTADLERALAHHVAVVRTRAQRRDEGATASALAPGPLPDRPRLGPEDAGLVAQVGTLLRQGADDAEVDALLARMGLGQDTPHAERLARLALIERELVTLPGRGLAGELDAEAFARLSARATGGPDGAEDAARDARALEILSATFRGEVSADEPAAVEALQAFLDQVGENPAVRRAALGFHVARALGGTDADRLDPDQAFALLEARIRSFRDPELRRRALAMVRSSRSDEAGLLDEARGSVGLESGMDRSIGALRRLREGVARPTEVAANLVQGLVAWARNREGRDLPDEVLDALLDLPPDAFLAFRQAVRDDPELFQQLPVDTAVLLTTVTAHDPDVARDPDRLAAAEQERFAERLQARRQSQARTAVKGFLSEGEDATAALARGERGTRAKADAVQARLQALALWTAPDTDPAKRARILELVSADEVARWKSDLARAERLPPGRRAQLQALAELVEAQIRGADAEALEGARRRAAAADIAASFEALRTSDDADADVARLEAQLDDFASTWSPEALADALAQVNHRYDVDTDALMSPARTGMLRREHATSPAIRMAARRARGEAVPEDERAAALLDSAEGLPPSTVAALDRCRTPEEAQALLDGIAAKRGKGGPKDRDAVVADLMKRARTPEERAALVRALAKTLDPVELATLELSASKGRWFRRDKPAPGLLALTADMPADQVDDFLEQVARRSGLANAEALRAALLERVDGATARIRTEEALAGSTAGLEPAERARRERDLLLRTLAHEGLARETDGALVPIDKDGPVEAGRDRGRFAQAVIGWYYDTLGRESDRQFSEQVDSRRALLAAVEGMRPWLDPDSPEGRALERGDPDAIERFGAARERLEAARKFENLNAAQEAADARGALGLATSAVTAHTLGWMQLADPALFEAMGGAYKMLATGVMKGSGGAAGELVGQGLDPEAETNKVDVAHAFVVKGVVNAFVGDLVGTAAGEGAHTALGGTAAKGELADVAGALWKGMAGETAKQITDDRMRHLVGRIAGEEGEGPDLLASAGQGLAKGAMKAGYDGVLAGPEGGLKQLDDTKTLGDGADWGRTLLEGGKGPTGDLLEDNAATTLDRELVAARARAAALLAGNELDAAEHAFVQALHDELTQRLKAQRAKGPAPIYRPLELDGPLATTDAAGRTQADWLDADRREHTRRGVALADRRTALERDRGDAGDVRTVPAPFPEGVGHEDLPDNLRRHARMEVDGDGRPWRDDRERERQGRLLARAAKDEGIRRRADGRQRASERRADTLLASFLAEDGADPEVRERADALRRRLRGLFSDGGGKGIDPSREVEGLPEPLRASVQGALEERKRALREQELATGRLASLERDLEDAERLAWDRIRREHRRDLDDRSRRLEEEEAAHAESASRLADRQRALDDVVAVARAAADPESETTPDDLRASVDEAIRAGAFGDDPLLARGLHKGRPDLVASEGSDSVARLAATLEAAGVDPRSLGLHLFDDRDRARREDIQRAADALARDPALGAHLDVEDPPPGARGTVDRSDVDASLPVAQVRLRGASRIEIHAADLPGGVSSRMVQRGDRRILYVDRGQSPGAFQATVARELAAAATGEDAEGPTPRQVEERVLRESGRRGDRQAAARHRARSGSAEPSESA